MWTTPKKTLEDAEVFATYCYNVLLGDGTCRTQTEAYRYIAEKVGVKPCHIEQLLRGEIKSVKAHLYLNLKTFSKELRG